MTTTTNLTSKDLVFTEGNHRYHVKDSKPQVYIPSVTTICGLLDKPFLVEWAARCASEAAVAATMGHEGAMNDETVENLIAVGRKAHRDVREEGANVGTAVHQQVKMLLQPGWAPEEGDAVDGGIEAEMAMSAFEEWHGEHVIALGGEVVMVEQMVVHPTGTYCGTFDLLLWLPEQEHFRLIDWKTSNQSDSNPCALYPEYLFQTAAYVRAVEDSHEWPDIKEIKDAQVVALGKNGQLACTTLHQTEIDKFADAFMQLTSILAPVREAQRLIRAFNKDEKVRRENRDFEVHAKAATE